MDTAAMPLVCKVPVFLRIKLSVINLWTLMGTIIYKIHISYWAHKLLKKLFSRGLNQGIMGSFSIDVFVYK